MKVLWTFEISPFKGWVVAECIVPRFGVAKISISLSYKFQFWLECFRWYSISYLGWDPLAKQILRHSSTQYRYVVHVDTTSDLSSRVCLVQASQSPEIIAHPGNGNVATPRPLLRHLIFIDHTSYLGSQSSTILFKLASSLSRATYCSFSYRTTDRHVLPLALAQEPESPPD